MIDASCSLLLVVWCWRVVVASVVVNCSLVLVVCGRVCCLLNFAVVEVCRLLLFVA